jgi:hypothetical protein
MIHPVAVFWHYQYQTASGLEVVVEVNTYCNSSYSNNNDQSGGGASE